MKELLPKLLIAVITAVIPVLTGFFISYINKSKAQVEASTDDKLIQRYISEIATAISDAVAATSQTYVDAMKQSGEFTKEAQKEAAERALAACLASISLDAQKFIESSYGDIVKYLTNRIEAEVRNQKMNA